MVKGLTASVLGFSTLLFLASCSKPSAPIETVKVVTQEVLPPKPVVPKVDVLTMREVEWLIVTPDNVDEIFAKMEVKVLFALTTDGYEAVSLNLSDVRKLIDQKNKIIVLYEKQWDRDINKNTK